jgi:hypothetical protein
MARPGELVLLGALPVAYLLYFRLIENVGPTNTLTVTFLIPVSFSASC